MGVTATQTDRMGAALKRYSDLLLGLGCWGSW